MYKRMYIFKLDDEQVNIIRKIKNKDICNQLNNQLQEELIIRLIKYRKEKGISQNKLANQLGVCREAVMKWENGKCHLQNGTKKLVEDFLEKEGY